MVPLDHSIEHLSLCTASCWATYQRDIWQQPSPSHQSASCLTADLKVFMAPCIKWFSSLCVCQAPKSRLGPGDRGTTKARQSIQLKQNVKRNDGTGSWVWNFTVLGRAYFIESYHLSSSRLKRLSIPLTDAYAAAFSRKKYQCQLFLSSVVESLQEQFSNISCAPLKETGCAGGTRGGRGEPWLGKGWPDPAGSRGPNQGVCTAAKPGQFHSDTGLPAQLHVELAVWPGVYLCLDEMGSNFQISIMAASEFIPLPFQRQPQYFILFFFYPLISAYLLPSICFQSEWSPFLWLCPCLIHFPLLSHLHVPSFPLWTAFRDVSAKPLCVHHSFAPFWKENLPGFFCIWCVPCEDA